MRRSSPAWPGSGGLDYPEPMSLDSVQACPEAIVTGAATQSIRRLGMASLVLAILAVVLEVIAIAIGSGGAWGAATVLAWFIVSLFAVSIALGVAAILTGNGRRRGIGAVMVSLLANPLVLVWLFSLLRGLS